MLNYIVSYHISFIPINTVSSGVDKQFEILGQLTVTVFYKQLYFFVWLLKLMENLIRVFLLSLMIVFMQI